MARKLWQGSLSGDVNLAGNWSGGVPVGSDVAVIDDTSASMTSNLTSLGALDLTIEVGPNFSGKIGTSSSPLTSAATTIKYYGTKCKGAYLQPTSGNAYIKGTANVESALLLGGTMTDVVVSGNSNVVLKSGLTATNLRIVNAAEVTLESGCTLTNAYTCAGTIHCHAAVTNIYMAAGVWYHKGNSTFDITLLEVQGPNARFQCHTPGITIGNTIVRAGRFDVTGQGGSAITLTNSSVYGPNGVLNLDNKVDSVVTTNPTDVFGGIVVAGTSTTQSVKLPAWS